MAKDKHDPKWLNLVDQAFAQDEQEPFLSQMEDPEFPDDSGTKGGAGSGNFNHSGRPGIVGGSGGESASRRSQLAKATHIPVTKEKRRQATKSEAKVAELVGGVFSGDNQPFDVTTPTHGIEVKTIFPGSKTPHITMHPESLARKLAAAKKNKLKPATIVIDQRHSQAQFYFKKGVGGFRLSAMEKLDPAELRSRLEQ